MSGEYGRCSKTVTLCLARLFWTTCDRCAGVQKKPAVLCPFFLTFPSPCILEATEDFSVHFPRVKQIAIHNVIVFYSLLYQSIRHVSAPFLVAILRYITIMY
jgi:hypothetical protein